MNHIRKVHNTNCYCPRVIVADSGSLCAKGKFCLVVMMSVVAFAIVVALFSVC